jgi:hypothetical protein
MTFVEEFNQPDDDLLLEEENYPVAFGITFTPKVQGIALALLGLVGAGYVLMNFVAPAYESYQKLKTEEAEKLDQVKQQESGALGQKLIAAEAQLHQSEALRSQVLGLFSSNDSLKTLLFDVGSLVKARGATLLSFAPSGDLAVVSDGSLGESVNNKLKRQSFALEVSGTYDQIQTLMIDLERLQPLLIVKGLNTSPLEAATAVNVVGMKVENGRVVSQGQVMPKANEKLKAGFSLDAILPLTPEEIAQLAPPPPAEGTPPEGEQPPAEGEQPPAEEKPQ